MFTATYRLPLGVALFAISSSAAADIVLESDRVPELILVLWAAIGFIALVLIGLWQDDFVDPVEHDRAQRKKLAFHRGLGGFITLLIGSLSGAAFVWVFGPIITLSTKPWLSPFGQGFVQVTATLLAVMAFALCALYLPVTLFQLRRALRKALCKEPTTAQVIP